MSTSVVRPTWSAEAADRVRRLSRARLHAYAEGTTIDPFFYGTICAIECADRFDYRLVLAHEISGAENHRGKAGLLREHDRLTQAGLLTGTDGARGYTSIFFLDKDADDVVGSLVECDHVVYTHTYDVEGTVFRHGDLDGAVAAVCSLDPASVRGWFGDGAEWTESAGRCWQEWLVVCLFAQLVGGVPGCSFGRTSPLNHPADAPTDALALVGYLGEVHQRGAGSSAEKVVALSTAASHVQKVSEAGAIHTIFKGKWYPHLLVAQVHRRYPAKAAMSSFADRVVAALLQSLDFSAAWAERFRQPIREVLADTV